VIGIVRVAGSTPNVQVIIEPLEAAEAPVEVRGDYRAELLRLDGARVRASGRRSAATQLTVADYTLQEIGGHVPLVGVLQASADAVTLQPAGGDVVVLRAAPADLKAQIGAKVWVILDENGAVAGYGVIRER
jgi:hypothetical protein